MVLEALARRRRQKLSATKGKLGNIQCPLEQYDDASGVVWVRAESH